MPYDFLANQYLAKSDVLLLAARRTEEPGIYSSYGSIILSLFTR